MPYLACRTVIAAVLAALPALPTGAHAAGPAAAAHADSASPDPADPRDRNGDRSVSRDEFLRFRLQLVIGPEQDRAHWEAAARLAFAACDLDGNGELDAEELKRHPECGF